MKRFLEKKEIQKNTGMLSRFIFKGSLFFIICSLLSGCALGRLDQVLINEVPAQKDQLNTVQIIREDRVTVTNLRMELKKGDEIKTDSESTAIIWLQGGSKIIIGPDTHIRLVNPNHIIEMLSAIGEKISKLFIEAKGVLQVNTDYVSAASVGTNFMITRGPDNDVSVTVLEGTVSLESKTERFSPVRLTRFTKALILGEQSPNVEPIEKNEINTIIDWVNRIKSISYKTNIRLLLPDVIGLPVHEAEQVLREAGFFVGKKVARITGREPLDTIIEQSPVSGSLMSKGGSVILYFEAEPVYVPSLIGLNRDEAIRVLSDNKLSLGSIQESITGTARAYTVIGQSPSAQTRVPSGSKVDLVIEAESVVMPDFINMHIEQAFYLIRQKNLIMGRQLKELTDRFREGTVIGQSILSGTRVYPGTAVDLTVAEAGVLVPNFENMHIDQALYLIREKNLIMGRQLKELTDRYREGTIIGQSILPGTRVYPGTAIDLTVAEAGVRVPNIENISLQQADQILNNTGLYRGNITQIQTDRYSSGTIMSQWPRAGTLVRRGSTIDIEMAKRPSYIIPSTPTIKQCMVPNLIGMNRNQAIELLNRSGFRWVEKRVNVWQNAEKVIKQEPGPNTQVPCGSSITIFICYVLY